MISRLNDDRHLFVGSVSVGRLRELLAGFQDWDKVTFERHYVKDGNDALDFIDVFEFSEIVEEVNGARVVVKLDFAGTLK
jgi:hypothetical protein